MSDPIGPYFERSPNIFCLRRFTRMRKNFQAGFANLIERRTKQRPGCSSFITTDSEADQGRMVAVHGEFRSLKYVIGTKLTNGVKDPANLNWGLLPFFDQRFRDSSCILIPPQANTSRVNHLGVDDALGMKASKGPPGEQAIRFHSLQLRYCKFEAAQKSGEIAKGHLSIYISPGQCRIDCEQSILIQTSFEMQMQFGVPVGTCHNTYDAPRRGSRDS